MSAAPERVALRPFEKRLVAGVATALFVVLNFWFVFPHFGDWAKLKNRHEMAQKKLLRYQSEIAEIPRVKVSLDGLAGGGGGEIPPWEQALHFSTMINSKAAQTGVTVLRTGSVMSRTNDQFFLEQSMTISTQSGEPQLVDFLYKLGSGASPIRVRGLNVKPDGPRQALAANVTLVASYQVKPGGKPGPAPKGGTKR
jgi:hypothetical protein